MRKSLKREAFSNVFPVNNQGEFVMEKIQKKIGAFMAVAMGLTQSIVLSTFNNLMSGRFMLPMLIISILISSAISITIGFIIPTKKISDKVVEKINNKIVKTMLGNLVVSAFYSVIITTVLVFVMVGMANMNITRQQAELQGQLDGLTDIVALQEIELANEEQGSEKFIELTASINEKKGQSEGIKQQISGMEAGRPNAVRQLPRSLLLSILVSWITSTIVQPLYLKMAFKKYGIA